MLDFLSVRGLFMKFLGPNDKVNSIDDETVEILEIIENCDEYSDFDDEEIIDEYIPEY